MEHQHLTQTALDCGASKAAILEQSAIVYSRDFRVICEQNTCGNYGNCWMCPPDIGDAETVIKEARQYPHGLLYQTIHDIEDSFDFEGMQEAKQKHMQATWRLQEALADRFAGLHLSVGACGWCETCAKAENLPCRTPERALPSLESYCIDVFKTTENTPLRYINGQNTVTYFGLLLFR